MSGTPQALGKCAPLPASGCSVPRGAWSEDSSHPSKIKLASALEITVLIASYHCQVLKQEVHSFKQLMLNEYLRTGHLGVPGNGNVTISRIYVGLA